MAFILKNKIKIMWYVNDKYDWKKTHISNKLSHPPIDDTLDYDVCLLIILILLEITTPFTLQTSTIITSNWYGGYNLVDLDEMIND